MKSMTTEEFDIRLPGLTFFLSAVIFSLCLSPILFTDGVWSASEGNRMIVMAGDPDLSGHLNSPLAQELGPGLHPYAAPFFLPGEEQGVYRSVCPPFFSYAMSYLYRLGGFPVPRYFILLTAFACIVLIGWAAKILGFHPRKQALSILAAGFLTPLLFYAGVLLETVPAVMLTLAFFIPALLGLDSKRLTMWCLAGLLLGLSAYLREETYAIFPAALAGMVLCEVKFKNMIAFLLVFLGAILPLMLFNALHTGSLLGSGYGVDPLTPGNHFSFSELLKNLYFFLFQPNTAGVLGPALGAIGIMSLFFGFLPDDRPVRLRVKGLVLGIAAVAALFNLYYLYFSEQPLRDTQFFQSVCGTVPLVLVPAIFFRSLFHDPDKKIRFTALLTLLSMAGIAAMLNTGAAGMTFGPRHFLPILPLAALLCIHAASLPQLEGRNGNVIRWGIFLLCLASLWSQIFGISLLNRKKMWSDELARTCNSLEAPLLATDVSWAPEELAALSKPHRILFLSDAHGAASLKDYVDKARIRRFHLLVSNYYMNIPNEALNRFTPEWRISSECFFTSPDMEYLELQLLRFERVTTPPETLKNLRAGAGSVVKQRQQDSSVQTKEARP